MAKFEDLPIEIVNIIFAHVHKAPPLHLFLMSKRTHRSAKMAMYKHISIKVSSLERLRFAISFSRMLRDAPKILCLQLRGPLLEQSKWTWDMNNVEFATLAIDGLLRQANEVTTLRLLDMPNVFAPKIDALTRLEDLTICQDHTSHGLRILAIDVSQIQTLQSLYVCTLSLSIVGPNISTTLKHLTLAWGTTLEYNGHRHDLFRRAGPVLPFTRLETVDIIMNRTLSTARWLEALAHQLSASRNTLRLLAVWCEAGYQEKTCNHIDFQAYTALQKIRFSLAAFKPSESGTLYTHEFRIHLAAPTVSEIEIFLQSPIAEHTLKNGLLKFICDNRLRSRMPLLKLIKLSVKQDLADEWRKKSVSTTPPTSQQLRTSKYERLIYSDGKVEWMPVVGYLSTIRAMRVILDSGWAKLIGTMYSIRIDLDDVERLVKREDALEMVRVETISSLNQDTYGAARELPFGWLRNE